MKINTLSKRHVIFMDDTVFEGIFVNMHLIQTVHRNYLIDTGMGSESTDVVQKYLESQKNAKPLVIINTHDHWDHVWGNGSIDACAIVSHRKTRENLEKIWDRDVVEHKKFIRGNVIRRLPNITFEDYLCFEDDGIELGYTPAHSDNDIYIYDHVEKVLNVGDNLGDSDADLLPDLTLESKDLKNAIKHFQTFEIKHVVSGHNKVVDKEHFNRMLEAL